MKPGEKGYTLVELLIALTIMVSASGAAGAAIFQVLKNVEQNNHRLTVVRQVENAGYWISRDAQMSQSVTSSGNLTLPDFLFLSWTEWTDNSTAIYHSANYTIEGLADGITVGTLKRNYLSATTNQTTLIAKYIYYAPGDTANTSNVSYQSSLLTVRLTTLFEGIQETREYQIRQRPNLY